MNIHPILLLHTYIVFSANKFGYTDGYFLFCNTTAVVAGTYY